MNYFSPLYIFLVGWLLLLASDTFQLIGAVNGILQLLLFTLVVCIPTWRTGRMSYVDIGWPWGLVLIGAVTFALSDGYTARVAIVSALYAFMGGRMGIYAIKLWRVGKLQRELPRYEFQKRRWQKVGKTNVPLAQQVEVLIQGLANASFLALPAFIIAANPAPTFCPVEYIGLAVALLSFMLEHVADLQKAAFAARCKKAGERNKVCNVGLWRYSRHPNYFFEWMVWNGLILMALPSLGHLFSIEPRFVAGLMAAGLFFVSRLMYQTLVHYTGARPAEFYSVQKRPDYVEYQKTTNMFFPGPPRK